MKTKSIFALTAVMIGGGAYTANAANDFVDTAQVISAKPIIERVAESHQECDSVPAPQKDTNYVAPIIGGVLGGLLGHQVGRGSGQTAATVVGATGGAVAGSVLGNRPGKPTEQCRTVESSRDVVNGYDVVYHYNGRDIAVKLPYDPGQTIKVGVNAIVDEPSGDAGREGRHKRGSRSSDAGGAYGHNQ